MMKHVRRGLIVCLCLSFLLSLHVQAQEPLPELMLDDPMAVETELEQADAFWNGYDIGWSDGYAAGYSVWEAGEEPDHTHILQGREEPHGPLHHSFNGLEGVLLFIVHKLPGSTN